DEPYGRGIDGPDAIELDVDRLSAAEVLLADVLRQVAGVAIEAIRLSVAVILDGFVQAASRDQRDEQGVSGAWVHCVLQLAPTELPRDPAARSSTLFTGPSRRREEDSCL